MSAAGSQNASRPDRCAIPAGWKHCATGNTGRDPCEGSMAGSRNQSTCLKGIREPIISSVARLLIRGSRSAPRNTELRNTAHDPLGGEVPPPEESGDRFDSQTICESRKPGDRAFL